MINASIVIQQNKWQSGVLLLIIPRRRAGQCDREGAADDDKEKCYFDGLLDRWDDVLVKGMDSPQLEINI